MRELYRHRDITTVSFYDSLLKQEGIPTVIRNETIQMSGITEIPIVEFYPNICVLHEEDYERAREILKKVMETEAVNAEKEILCPQCGEPNPGNFELCYACGVEF